MKVRLQNILSVGTTIVAAAVAVTMAQAPAPAGAEAGRGGAPRPVLSVTSTAFPDGGEVPECAIPGRGDNKSPAFEFHWTVSNTPADAPANLQTYAVILHDVENSTARERSIRSTGPRSTFRAPRKV